MGTWDPAARGVVRLPSGRLVRGRGLSVPTDGAEPEFGVYLLGHAPDPMPWPSRWVRWPDFRLPTEDAQLLDALVEAHALAPLERVELACGGGVGRTGTALACLAVIDGIDPAEAVAWVRRAYDPRAVETPWQRRYVRRFRGPAPGAP